MVAQVLAAAAVVVQIMLARQRLDILADLAEQEVLQAAAGRAVLVGIILLQVRLAAAAVVLLAREQMAGRLLAAVELEQLELVAQ